MEVKFSLNVMGVHKSLRVLKKNCDVLTRNLTYLFFLDPMTDICQAKGKSTKKK